MNLVQMRGDGDCLRAAVATILGLELDDTPAACNGSDDDPHTVQMAWLDWFAGRGLAMSDDQNYAPVFLPLWIAMVAVGPFAERHALVMSYDRLLYDPATVPGSPQRAINPADILLSMIVGPPEWVMEQDREMRVRAHHGQPGVWALAGNPFMQMTQGERS